MVPDPALNGCSSALRDPSVQFWTELRATARKDERERQRLRQLRTEEEQREREGAEVEQAKQQKERAERQAQMHEHPLARIGTHTWVPTKHWRCDGCGNSSVTTEMIRYRCTYGCNVDLCDSCYGPDAQAIAEARAEEADIVVGVCGKSVASLPSAPPELSRAQQRARARLRARQEGRPLDNELQPPDLVNYDWSPLGEPPPALSTFAPSSMQQPSEVVSSPLAAAGELHSSPAIGRVPCALSGVAAGANISSGATAAVVRGPEPRALQGAAGNMRRATRSAVKPATAASAARAPTGPPPAPPSGPDMELRRRAAERGERVFRVVHTPHVTVRAKPRNTARTLFVLYPGEEISSSSEPSVNSHWLQLSGGPVRVAAQLAAASAGETSQGGSSGSGCWVLADASDVGLGRLLEPA